MRNWSMVRTGTTASQKSLFFNLKRVQAQLEREAQATGDSLDRHQLDQMIATEIGVSVADVQMMTGRLAGSDFSLNAMQSNDEEGREWIEALEDDGPQAAEHIEDQHDSQVMQSWINEALDGLNERERFIVVARKLGEKPRTLQCLGEELGLSKERVRQLETAAFEKMRKQMTPHQREVIAYLT